MIAEPPELWWSPSFAAKGNGTTDGLIEVTAIEPYRQWMRDWHPIRRVPDDAVPLGVIEDPKHRGPSYRRGYSDGFNACRAGVPSPTEENNRG